jgi:protein required for attachment to host cells
MRTLAPVLFRKMPALELAVAAPGDAEHFRQFRHQTLIQLTNKDKMAATWILSANAGRARFFSQEKSSEPLQEVNDMTNSTVRLRTSETERDDIGLRSASNSQHSVGAPTPQSGYEPNQTPAEHQTELFARDVAGFLQQAYQEGRFEQLILVASPEFLGILRKLLDPRVQSAVSREINKDYTQSNTKQLREQLQALEEKG